MLGKGHHLIFRLNQFTMAYKVPWLISACIILPEPGGWTYAYMWKTGKILLINSIWWSRLCVDAFIQSWHVDSTSLFLLKSQYHMRNNYMIATELFHTVFGKIEHFYYYIDITMTFFFSVLIQMKPSKNDFEGNTKFTNWLESSSFPKAGSLRGSSFFLPSPHGLDFTGNSIFAVVNLVFKYKRRSWAPLLLLARKLKSVLSLSLWNSEKTALWWQG